MKLGRNFSLADYLSKKNIRALPNNWLQAHINSMNPSRANAFLLSEEQANQSIIKRYQSAISFLMWPTIHTQSSISYSVRIFSQYYTNIAPIYCNLVILIFWYLARSLKLKITLKFNSANELVRYTDSDWAELKDRQRSIGRYIFFLSRELVSHQSKY